MNGPTNVGKGRPSFGGPTRGNSGGGGGAFPGFGVTSQAIGPSTAGTAPTAARSDHQHAWRHVANQAALDALSAATMLDGQKVWVDSYKDSFTLTASTQAVAADVRRTALGKAGYLWIRDGFSPGWWSQTAWFLTSAAAANNEDNGATSGTPISPQEYRRRHFLRWLPGTETAGVTLTVTADLGDNDFIQVEWGNGLRGGPVLLTVVGAQTVVATGVISAATALNRATNVPNSITAGFSFATHVGRLLRLQGTTTTTAWVTKDLGANTGRLSEQNVASATGTGFTAGQTVEVVTLTKVPGIHILAGPSSLSVSDCDFDPAIATHLRADSIGSTFTFTRCRFRSSTSAIVTAGYCTFSACGFVDRPWSVRASTVLSLCAQINQTTTGLTIGNAVTGEFSLSSHVQQASTLSLTERTYAHVSGGGSGTHAIFDLAAAQIGVSVGVGAWFDAAAMYGDGNNATSVIVSLLTGGTYSHATGVSVMTIAGGVGLRLLCGGVALDVPMIQLPHNIGSGQQPGSSLNFSGSLDTDAGGATFAYLANPGTLLAAAGANQILPQRYPTSERLALRLRVTKRIGAGVLTNNVTATVYKSGVATTMTVTILAADAINTKYVDSAHPILFADNEDIDVRLDDAADVLAGVLLVSAQVEFAN